MRSRILNSSMIRILGTIFAGLLGLAFGSFLNVCLSRWPAGESIVLPRSHCRHCNRTLTWWENVPLASWLALRGRCRTCRAWIGWRYPLVELAVGTLWATFIWHISEQFMVSDIAIQLGIVPPHIGIIPLIGTLFFLWLLVGIAVLDAEHFWIADAVTLPGIALGIAFSVLSLPILQMPLREQTAFWIRLGERLVEVLAAAALILLIRWVYWLIRRREGIGLGDAKLMAMLAAWLGLPGALLSFVLGVTLGALVAIVLLAVPSAQRETESWAMSKLPLGTFLCIGGIVSSLWGQPILSAYLRWAGF
jgi:leader peptidase (prepilin peptidase)/N-methyltransferase